MTSHERGQPPEQWGSSLGFVLAAAGSAVGLGNLWGFAYRASQGGGAAFVVLYLLIVSVVCLPVLVAEMVLGRSTGHAPLLAPITAGGRRWAPLGWLFLAAAMGILSYYAVLMGWTGRSLIHALSSPLPADIPAAERFFAGISSGGDAVLGHLISLALTGVVVAAGIKAGIERLTRWAMPLLFLLLLALAIWAAFLPGAHAGYSGFLLRWDPSKLTDLGTIRNAFTQAFFSIGTGIGAILAYATYLDRKSALPGEAVAVVGMDTAVGLMAGCITFPLVASFGLVDVVSGSTVGTLFISLPTGLASLGGGGRVVAALFPIGLRGRHHLIGLAAGGAGELVDGSLGLEPLQGRLADGAADCRDRPSFCFGHWGAGADGCPLWRGLPDRGWPADGPAAGLAGARSFPQRSAGVGVLA